MDSRQSAGAAEFHDGVVVVSGAVFRPVVAFFDAERAAWSHWPHLRTPRVQSALVALSDDIFVLVQLNILLVSRLMQRKCVSTLQLMPNIRTKCLLHHV